MKLDALEQAVKTLVLNGQDEASAGSNPGKIAYAILTQKLYGVHADEPERQAALK